MNNENLLKPEDRTPKERRESARNAGKASGEAFHRMRDMKSRMQMILSLPAQNTNDWNLAAEMGVELDEIDKAVLTARTESHRNQEAGMLDCAKEISNGVDGSGLIYTATWRTMQDERVRPNRRYHTKSGWKTVRRGKANHEKMEGKIILVGDRFDLGDGVYAEAPGSSGVAAHDCNCRCYLEYALMTPEEFVAAGGKLEGNGFTSQNDSDIINTYPEIDHIVPLSHQIPGSVRNSISEAESVIMQDFPSIVGCHDPIQYGYVVEGYANHSFNLGTGHCTITLLDSAFSGPERLMSLLRADFDSYRSYEVTSIQSLFAHEMGYNAHLLLALRRCGIPYGTPISMTEWGKVCAEKQKILHDIYDLCFPGWKDNLKVVEQKSIIDFGLIAVDPPEELIAQAFGKHYYGKKRSKIAESIVKYYIGELS